jgi:hypothetical protein
MRHIHAVGPLEKFVASGTYVHYLNDKTTGSQEHWAIHELPDSTQLVRVDDDHRQRDGSSVLIHAWRNAEAEGGHFERVDVHAFGGKQAEVKQVRASYMIDETQLLEFGRNIDRGERQQEAVDLPEGYLLSPESLIFAGFEVDELAARRLQTPIVGYLPAFIKETAFRPVIYLQVAHFIAEETVTISGKAIPARCFDQINPGNGATTRLWIDKYGVLLQFTGPDGRHRAKLHDYARRPEQ